MFYDSVDLGVGVQCAKLDHGRRNLPGGEVLFTLSIKDVPGEDAPNHRITKVSVSGQVLGFVEEPGNGVNDIPFWAIGFVVRSGIQPTPAAQNAA